MRSSENASNISGGFRKRGRRGQTRMKLGRAQKVVRFRVWPPIEGQCNFLEVFLWSHPVFDQTRRYWCRVSLSLWKTLRNTWKLVPACSNTPSKNIQLIPSNVFKKSVSNGTKPTGRSSLCGKTSDPRSENRNENLGRFSLKKWFMTQRWFLLAFAFEHFQHYSGDDPTNLFPHPSLVLDSFATPPIKLNRDSKSLRNHWSQTTWTDHHDGPTFSVAVRSHIIRYF
jgi:hypothetical protein